MLKKLFMLVTVLLVTLTLAACSKDVYTVTFDTQGGNDVDAVEVEDGSTVDQPADPTREDAADGTVYSFVTWATDADGENPYDFSTPVTEDMTIYAVWSEEVVLRFETKLDTEIDPILLGEDGGDADAPTEPTRDGYRFGGWFYGRSGLTWLEPEAVEFPLEVTENTTLYAYWEPLDSTAVEYSEDETYVQSLDVSSSLVLNPLVYEWSHEDAFVDWMVTPMYATSVDWDKAIEDGVAEYVGDFSKIEDKTYSVEALDYVWNLMGATQYPLDSEGEEHLNEDGNYDREGAATIKDTEWTFNIREDLFFEDGTNITASTFEYTLKMFLSPDLNNYRANIFFRTDANKNGYPIVNAYEYFLGDETWENVGFEILDTYSFKITFFESVSQASAVAIANDLRLVHPTAFDESLTSGGTNSTYGTPDSPYVSYGQYILKSWDENAKLVFNKNYEYIGRETVMYKSRVIQIVEDIDQRMNLFEQGDLSVTGLNVDYYEDYAEADNVYKSWDGYPQYLILNLAESKLTEGGHVHPEIMFDVRFRQAMLYGFDRKYYATSVYAPNTASLLPVPLDTKAYNQDPLYYSESPQHLAVLEMFNIDPDTEGFIPERAQTLFNQAYADWEAVDGNDGPVEILFISTNDSFTMDLANYVEGHYEELFGTDKLDIVILSQDPAAHDADIENWNFDISLNSIGFGSSTGVWWQYQAIAFFGDWIGGGGLGLTQPHDVSQEDGLGAYVNQEIEVDLTNTYNYLMELGESYLIEEELEGHLELLGYLEEEVDENDAVIKDAGIYKGPMQDLALLMIFSDVPYDGAASEPFTGATNDTWNFVSAFEELFFEHVTAVPTVTRSSAIMYADNVEIWWPAYSSAFAWGTNRYRYLSSDPDYVDGLFNSFAE